MRWVSAALPHHVNVELLRLAFFELKRNAPHGVDGLIWRDYAADLERRLEDLHARVHRGAYRALPSRTTVYTEADGRQRPLEVAALEYKIVSPVLEIPRQFGVAMIPCC
jgi:RNA-directed DNA polymerase